MRIDSVVSSNAVSEQNSFAIPASTSARSPRSNFSAADRTSSFDASSLVAMSASLNWIAWCLLIGTPNVSRSNEYFIAASNAALATPTARAAMLMRPSSSEPRMKCFALLGGAEPLDQVGGDVVRVEHARERHPPVQELLHEPRVRDPIELEPAVLLRDPRPEQAERLHLFDHDLWVAVGMLEVR